MSSKIAAKMFTTRMDIPLDARQTLVSLLNQQLADTFDLYSQTKQAHWNVKGNRFFQLHGLFDELALPLLEYADMIAERVTALGGLAMGTARLAAENSTLPEYPYDLETGEQYLIAIAERFAAYAATTRQAIDGSESLGDAATADLFTEIVRGIDKSLYFIEGHLRS